jgi:hypothetical protein
LSTQIRGQNVTNANNFGMETESRASMQPPINYNEMLRNEGYYRSIIGNTGTFETSKAAKIPPLVEPHHFLQENMDKFPSSNKIGRIPKKIWITEMKKYAQKHGHSWQYNLSDTEEEEEVKQLQQREYPTPFFIDETRLSAMISPPQPPPPSSNGTSNEYEIDFGTNFDEQANLLEIYSEEKETYHRIRHRDTKITRLEPLNRHSSNYISPTSHSIGLEEVIFDPRTLTAEEEELTMHNEDANATGFVIDSFDTEYSISAPPIVTIAPEGDWGTNLPQETIAQQDIVNSTATSTRQLNGYAQQTEGEECWNWDGIEIIFVPRKGYCVKATRDLYPGYRFPYGGVILSILQGNSYRQRPTQPYVGNRLQEYLTAFHHEITS